MPEWFDDEVRSLERRSRDRELASNGDKMVLFYGSSSFTLWPEIETYFPRHRVMNHGFGGSTLVDCNEYFDRLVAGFRPAVIILYAGDNDLANGASPEDVLKALNAFITRKRQTLGAVPTAYVSIKVSPARFGIMHRIAYTNLIIQRRLAEETDVRFVDICRRMTGRGLLDFLDYYSLDSLHMNREGYRVMGKSVDEYLQGLNADGHNLDANATTVAPAWLQAGDHRRDS